MNPIRMRPKPCNDMGEALAQSAECRMAAEKAADRLEEMDKAHQRDVAKARQEGRPVPPEPLALTRAYRKAKRLRELGKMSAKQSLSPIYDLMAAMPRPVNTGKQHMPDTSVSTGFGNDPQVLRDLLAKTEQCMPIVWDRYRRLMDEHMANVTREEAAGRRALPKPEALLAAEGDLAVVMLAAKVLRAKLEAIGALP